jgi:hypothetical protein
MLGRLARGRLVACLARPFGALQVPSPLASKLQSELEEEKASYAPDPTIASFLKESEFQMLENEVTPLLKLQRTTKDVTVEITFEARAPLPAGEGEGEQQDEMSYVDFQVIVKREERKGGLAFECVSLNGEIQIMRMAYIDDVLRLQEETHLLEPNAYKGPDFMTLDEKTQKVLLDYLTHLGVDEDLVAFLDIYANDKEQRLYQRWLSEARSLAQ